MSHLKSPFLRATAPFVDSIETVMKMLGAYEFLPSNEMMTKGGKLICKDESPIQELCSNVLFLMCGYNSQQLNRTLLPAIIENTPAGKWTKLTKLNCLSLIGNIVSGSSVDQLAHYAHGINSGKFRMFDHGMTKNLFKYGSIFPPNYDLKKVTAKVFLHYTDNDWMAAVRDVNELAGKLGNLAGMFRIPDAKFNHLDFTYAIDADTLLYNRVIGFISEN